MNHLQASKKSIIVFTLSFLSACEPLPLGSKKEVESPASCLSQEKLYAPFNANCVSGAGTSGADPRFLLFPHAPFLARAHSVAMKACLIPAPDISEALTLEFQQHIETAILAWLEPLRSLSPDISQAVDITVVDDWQGESVDGRLCDDGASVYLSHRLYSGDGTKIDRAFAIVGDEVIWVKSTNGYNTVLHEFGHLFGLADTYIEENWRCREGFPNSIMCQSSWGTLLASDIAQLQRNYCLQNEGQGSNCFNQEQSSILDFITEAQDKFYFSCRNRTMSKAFYPYYTYSIESAGAVGKVNGLLSHDEQSISESINDSSYQLTLDIVVQNVGSIITEEEILSLTSEGLTVTSGGSVHQLSSCAYSTKFQTWASLVSNGSWLRQATAFDEAFQKAVSTKVYTSSNGSITIYSNEPGYTEIETMISASIEIEVFIAKSSESGFDLLYEESLPSGLISEAISSFVFDLSFYFLDSGEYVLLLEDELDRVIAVPFSI